MGREIMERKKERGETEKDSKGTKRCTGRQNDFGEIERRKTREEREGGRGETRETAVQTDGHEQNT